MCGSSLDCVVSGMDDIDNPVTEVPQSGFKVKCNDSLVFHDKYAEGSKRDWL